MTEINNLLKPRCQDCHLLEIETNMKTVYSFDKVISREIQIDCRHRVVCDTAEEASKKQ